MTDRSPIRIRTFLEVQKIWTLIYTSSCSPTGSVMFVAIPFSDRGRVRLRRVKSAGFPIEALDVRLAIQCFKIATSGCPVRGTYQAQESRY